MNRKNYIVFILLSGLILISGPFAYSKHLHLEKEYQNEYCTAQNGILEYKLDDNTRIDCLTDTHAIEFDFANKWAESVGQSLYYANKTNKKAGIVLIMENPTKEQIYLKRLKTISDLYNIDVFTMEKLKEDEQ